MSRRSLLTLGMSLAALAAVTRPALAHDGDPHDGAWWQAWSFEPVVLLLLGITLVAYLRGWRNLAGRSGRSNAHRRLRTWAFGAGMVLLFIALVSPVDVLAGELFWVHMLQHSLLMLAVAPLLVFAYPLPYLLLGLPPGARRWLGQSWSRMGGLRAVWSLLNRPLVAWLLQAALLWAWHAPALYQASVENEWVHAAQHASFLGSAMLFWWVILNPLGDRHVSRGTSILLLFTTALHSGLLGALLTFSTRVWYPVYVGRAETWGISALADQQLAGTIMWVPGGVIYLVSALWLMKTWLDSMESREKGGLV